MCLRLKGGCVCIFRIFYRTIDHSFQCVLKRPVEPFPFPIWSEYQSKSKLILSCSAYVVQRGSITAFIFCFLTTPVTDLLMCCCSDLLFWSAGRFSDVGTIYCTALTDWLDWFHVSAVPPRPWNWKKYCKLLPQSYWTGCILLHLQLIYPQMIHIVINYLPCITSFHSSASVCVW